jgi:filamentous hemagglutinin
MVMSKAISNQFSGTAGNNAALIMQVEQAGEKISREDVVGITKDSAGKIVWLEKGHLGAHASGLAHVIEEHGSQFNGKGIRNAEIPQYLLTAVKYGEIVGYQGRGNGRPIYEFKYEGKTHRVAITIGSNGYIVGANPQKVTED